MFSRTLILLSCLIFGMSGCTSSQPLNLQIAQTTVIDAWQTNQHIVWELEWPAAPLGGPLTVEIWQAQERYRFEILESPAPALIGETLIFDGQNAWRYNRFEAEAATIPTSPILSPVTDAFSMINKLLAKPPETARQEIVQLRQGRAQKIMLTYNDGSHLTFWRDEATGLPVKLLVDMTGHKITLQARSFEPLSNPPSGLFKLDY